MNIVLIGYRGTGKSTVARLVGKRLGWQVVSTDAAIIEKTKRSIPEIVDQFGWDHFRSLESEVCRTIAGKDCLVIDTGGGVILKKKNITALKANGVVVWLTAEIPTIIKRIGGDNQRPSLTGKKTFTEEIEEVLQERRSKYEAVADHVIPTDTDSPEHIAALIVARI